MNDLAAEAGITKPILYRHFGDRQGLVNAIAMELLTSLVGLPEQRVRALTQAEDDSILERVMTAPAPTPESLRSFLKSLVSTYLEGARREPELFRFVMQEDGFRTLGIELHPGSAPGTQLGYTLARLIRDALVEMGRDGEVADPIGQALAGAVEGSVRWWSTAGRGDSEAMAELIADLLWAGVKGVFD